MKQFIIPIVVIIAIYIIYRVVFSTTYVKLNSLEDGKKEVIRSSDELPGNNNSTNYCYSIWFYIRDWNYKFNEKKHILSRINNDSNPSPSITLGAIKNDLDIDIAYYSDTTKTDTGIHNCSIGNIPLQKWVNIIVSLNGRAVDIYLDGKLVRTCLLPGVAKVVSGTPVKITPDGGFSGWTSNVQYRANPVNPQEAYEIYKKGYGGSILGDLFNKYRIKVAFLEDNIETSSIEL
jgi:hypothetical protein